MEAKRKGPFISVEDLQERARISRAIIDIAGSTAAWILVPESNQISLLTCNPTHLGVKLIHGKCIPVRQE